MAGVTLTVMLVTSLWLGSTCKLIDEKLIIDPGDVTSRMHSGVTGQTGKTAFVIYEESHELMFRTVTVKHKYMVIYKYPSFLKFLRQQMKRLLVNTSVTNYRDYLCFILVCGKKCTEDIMNQVMELDNTIGLRSLFRHFSTWTIISHDPPPPLNISLDHVALMRIERPKETWKSFRNIQIRQDHLTEIYTLLWMPGCREWSSVYPGVQSGDRLLTTLFPNILRGLNGRELILTTLEWPAYTKRKLIDGKLSYTGASMDIIGHLGEKFNFSYTFMEPPDNLWGQKTENGSWSGVLGIVQRAEADICVCPYGLSDERKRAMDFSYPFEDNYFTVIYKRHNGDLFSWIYLASCFSWQVYLCGSVTLLLTVLLFAFIQKQKKVQMELGRNEHPASWFEIGISAPLRQASIPMSEISSAKLLVFSLYLFCLVMTAVYSGNLVAIMAAERHDVPFNTLKELAEQDEYEVGCFEGTYAENILKSSNSRVYKLLHRKLKMMKTTTEENSSNNDAFSTSLAKVLKEKFVLIVSDDIEKYMKSQTCELSTMKERFLHIYAGFQYPRNSPIKKLFDNQLLKFKEMGEIDQWASKWRSKPLDCVKPQIKPQLKIDHLKTVMAICSGCIVLATIVLLMERNKKKVQ